jgi:hypothetical protein
LFLGYLLILVNENGDVKLSFVDRRVVQHLDGLGRAEDGADLKVTQNQYMPGVNTTTSEFTAATPAL